MRKISVVICFFCLTFAEWQAGDEIRLPKTINVNDLTLGERGEVWVLTASSILKIDPATGDPLFVGDIAGGRLLAVLQDQMMLLDDKGRLHVSDIASGTERLESRLTLGSAEQAALAAADGEPLLCVLENGAVTFVTNGRVIGSMATLAERFAVVPGGDYADPGTPLYTLSANRVLAWTNGVFRAPEQYSSKVIYSSSGNIVDLAAGGDGTLFVLFADSIVVLGGDGEYRGRLNIDHLTSGGRLLTGTSNRMVLFDRFEKRLVPIEEKTLETNEAIVLGKNRPNPVDNYTEIEFTLAQAMTLNLTIYNLIGEPVRVVARGYYAAGRHTISWNGCDETGRLVPNGVYFYRLESKRGVAIRQLVVLR